MMPKENTGTTTEVPNLCENIEYTFKDSKITSVLQNVPADLKNVNTRLYITNPDGSAVGSDATNPNTSTFITQREVDNLNLNQYKAQTLIFIESERQTCEKVTLNKEQEEVILPKCERLNTDHTIQKYDPDPSCNSNTNKSVLFSFNEQVCSLQGQSLEFNLQSSECVTNSNVDSNAVLCNSQTSEYRDGKIITKVYPTSNAGDSDIVKITASTYYNVTGARSSSDSVLYEKKVQEFNASNPYNKNIGAEFSFNAIDPATTYITEVLAEGKNGGRELCPARTVTTPVSNPSALGDITDLCSNISYSYANNQIVGTLKYNTDFVSEINGSNVESILNKNNQTIETKGFEYDDEYQASLEFENIDEGTYTIRTRVNSIEEVGEQKYCPDKTVTVNTATALPKCSREDENHYNVKYDPDPSCNNNQVKNITYSFKSGGAGAVCDLQNQSKDFNLKSNLCLTTNNPAENPNEQTGTIKSTKVDLSQVSKDAGLKFADKPFGKYDITVELDVTNQGTANNQLSLSVDMFDIAKTRSIANDTNAFLYDTNNQPDLGRFIIHCDLDTSKTTADVVDNNLVIDNTSSSNLISTVNDSGITCLYEQVEGNKYRLVFKDLPVVWFAYYRFYSLIF